MTVTLDALGTLVQRMLTEQRQHQAKLDAKIEDLRAELLGRFDGLRAREDHILEELGALRTDQELLAEHVRRLDDRLQPLAPK